MRKKGGEKTGGGGERVVAVKYALAELFSRGVRGVNREWLDCAIPAPINVLQSIANMRANTLRMA